MTATITAAIAETLGGAVHELGALATVSDLASATAVDASWSLSGEAVARVVDQYRTGAITAEQAQAWAFFVRHGFMATAGLPVMPIDIEWELAREEAIAEATTRLEELGDMIDGELDSQEASELVRMLRA